MRRTLALIATATVATAALIVMAPPAAAEGEEPIVDTGAAAELFDLANRERAAAGLAPLTMRADIADIANGHSMQMARAGDIFHNDAYFTAATRNRLGLRALGENVGMAGSVASVHKALMDSPPHRANILNGSFTVAGFGLVRSGDGAVYVAENFGTPVAGAATAAPAAAKPAPRPAAKPAPKPAPAPRPAAPRPVVRPAAMKAAPPVTIAPAPPAPAPAPAPAATAPTSPPVETANAELASSDLGAAPAGFAAVLLLAFALAGLAKTALGLRHRARQRSLVL